VGSWRSSSRASTRRDLDRRVPPPDGKRVPTPPSRLPGAYRFRTRRFNAFCTSRKLPRRAGSSGTPPSLSVRRATPEDVLQDVVGSFPEPIRSGVVRRSHNVPFETPRAPPRNPRRRIGQAARRSSSEFSSLTLTVHVAPKTLYGRRFLRIIVLVRTYSSPQWRYPYRTRPENGLTMRARPEIFDHSAHREARRWTLECATGATSAALKTRQDVHVTASNWSPSNSRRSRTTRSDPHVTLAVICGEWRRLAATWAASYTCSPPTSSSTCARPWVVPESLRRPARARGTAVVSLPTSASYSGVPTQLWTIIPNLVARQLPRRPESSIFDAHHLRWFTLPTTLCLLRVAGLEPVTSMLPRLGSCARFAAGRVRRAVRRVPVCARLSSFQYLSKPALCCPPMPVLRLFEDLQGLILRPRLDSTVDLRDRDRRRHGGGDLPRLACAGQASRQTHERACASCCRDMRPVGSGSWRRATGYGSPAEAPHVLYSGMVGTEMLYFAVFSRELDGGLIALHRPPHNRRPTRARRCSSAGRRASGDARRRTNPLPFGGRTAEAPGGGSYDQLDLYAALPGAAPLRSVDTSAVGALKGVVDGRHGMAGRGRPDPRQLDKLDADRDLLTAGRRVPPTTGRTRLLPETARVHIRRVPRRARLGSRGTSTPTAAALQIDGNGEFVPGDFLHRALAASVLEKTPGAYSLKRRRASRPCDTVRSTFGGHRAV